MIITLNILIPYHIYYIFFTSALFRYPELEKVTKKLKLILDLEKSVAFSEKSTM